MVVMVGKKVLAISGSPRNGNTDAMLKRVLDSARESGARIELVKLCDKNIEFCDGCDRCCKAHHCHLVDDMQMIYKKIFESTAIVLGSPNYFNNVSALIKNFIDRMNPYYEDERLKGKKVATVCVGGQSYESIKYCEQALEQFLRICSMKLVGKVWATADARREILENEKVMQQCFELGKKLVEE